jgi:hypothetical protein
MATLGAVVIGANILIWSEVAPAGVFPTEAPGKDRPGEGVPFRPARCHQVCYFGRSYGPLGPTRRRRSDVLVTLQSDETRWSDRFTL